jgi:hypothetical protein
MKITLIRDRTGDIIGAVFDHVAHHPPTQPSPGNQAGPMAVDGQSFEHVSVPEEFGTFRDNPREFGRRLKEHFRQPR